MGTIPGRCLSSTYCNVFKYKLLDFVSLLKKKQSSKVQRKAERSCSCISCSRTPLPFQCSITSLLRVSTRVFMLVNVCMLMFIVDVKCV